MALCLAETFSNIGAVVSISRAGSVMLVTGELPGAELSAAE